MEDLAFWRLPNAITPPFPEVSARCAHLSRARATAKMLVMDEPTANLDFGNRVRVLERVRSLAAGV